MTEALPKWIRGEPINTDAVAWALDIDTWSSPQGAERILKNITVSDTYDISARLCVPPNGAKRSHLQIANHGLVFDKRYWDVQVQPEEYSYASSETVMNPP